MILYIEKNKFFEGFSAKYTLSMLQNGDLQMID